MGIVYCLLFLFFFGLIIWINKSVDYLRSFNLYQNGIEIVPTIVNNDPTKKPFTFMDNSFITRGYIFRRKKIFYNEIISIHPSLYSLRWFYKSYWNAISLRVVMEEANGNYIGGDIILIGNKMEEMPKIIRLLKNRMGKEWKTKYHADEWICHIHDMEIPSGISSIVEIGTFSRESLLVDRTTL